MACKVSLQSLLATLIAISVANNGNGSAQVAGRCIAYVRPDTRIPSALLHVVPMPAWEQRKFSDMYEVNNERNTDCELGYDRTLSIATMTFNGGNGAADDSLNSYKVIRVGDIAFEGHANKVHAYGRFVLNDAGDGLMSPRFSCLRPIVEQRYSFWKYYIPHEETMRPILVKATKSGTMMNELVPDDLMRESILAPCLAEQEAIGDCLSQFDSLITLHQRKYDKLVILKKSMLEKMFPKDGESVPEIRFAGFTDPWEQRKFVDFVEASGIRNKDNLQLESYSVSNDRGFVPQDEQFENGGTMRDADKTAYWIVEPGSFAYNPARINVGSIGYQSTRKNVIVSSLYEVFKTDRSCDDRFLWHWFKSSLFTKQIEMLQEGGVRLYFFFDKLQKSEIWMPNVDEQRIIGQQFDQLDSLITLHQRKRLWFAK